MKEYKVYSDKLRLYLSQIEDDLLRERFKIFFSLHEHVHFQYSNNNNEPVQELRVAAEALCKLLIFVYVPNANSLFNNKDKLSHAYLKYGIRVLMTILKLKKSL